MSRDEFVHVTVDWINRRLAPPGVRVTADTPLFAGGLIDSLRILQLIAWTEQKTGQTIADRAVRMDNFQTVTRIAEIFVAQEPPS